MKLLEKFGNYYGGFLKDKNDNVRLQIIDDWHWILAEYPAELVYAAARKVLQEVKYNPTPADICTRIKAINNIDKPDAEYYWGLIEKASRNGAYNAKAEYDKLPRICQRALGYDYYRLQALAEMDAETVNSVARGQYIKSLNGDGHTQGIIEREELRGNTPPSVLEKMGVKPPIAYEAKLKELPPEADDGWREEYEARQEAQYAEVLAAMKPYIKPVTPELPDGLTAVERMERQTAWLRTKNNE